MTETFSFFAFMWSGKKKNPLLSKWIQEAPFGKNSYCFKRFHRTALILLLQKGYNLFVSLHSCLPHSNCDYIQIIKSCLQYDRTTASPAVLIGDYLYLYTNSAMQNGALEGQLLIHLWLNVWGVSEQKINLLVPSSSANSFTLRMYYKIRLIPLVV